MPNPIRGAFAGAVRPGRIVAAVLVFAAVAGACSSAQVTSAAVPTQTVLAATATPVGSASQAPGASASSATPSGGAPTPAPTHTAKPTPVPTPLPPLAVGLCKASQLKLQITAWVGDGFGDAYAHVTATNKSGVSCNMRGTSEARIVDGHSRIIADAGSKSATVSSSDPVYTVAPGGQISTILDWANWCKSPPAQKVFVAMVEPFGLGGIVAPAHGNAPIPSCYSKTDPTNVTSEAWLP
jgi:Protein of unknown function (DUF4232)